MIRGYEDGTLRPNNPITREEAAAIVARLLKLQPVEEDYLANYKDKNEISNWSKDAINSLVAKGLLAGYQDNTLGPKRFITRAETVVILSRALDFNTTAVVYDKPGTYGPESGIMTVTKNVEVKVPDVVLRNMVIKGDLLIAKEVGDGNVTLQNVTVEGKTLVNGGGEHSIYLENCSLAQVIVNKEDGKVRIVVKGDTKVDTVNVQSGAKIEGQNASKGIGKVVIEGNIPADAGIVLAGNFDEVEVKVAKVPVKVEEGMVNRINIAQGADEAKIELGEKAEVKVVEVNSKATISGKGYIETAVVKADGVTIEQKPFNLEIAENVTANIGGEEVKGSKTKESSTEGTSGGGGYTTPSTPPQPGSSSTGLFDEGYPAVVEIGENYAKVLFKNPRIDGQIYSVARLSTESKPTVDEIIQKPYFVNILQKGRNELVVFDNLQPGTEYNFYFVVTDEQRNVKSDIITLTAKTKASLLNELRFGTIGSNYVEIIVEKPTFDGRIYSMAKLPNEQAPTLSELINDQRGYNIVHKGENEGVTLHNLQSNTDYNLYFVATDTNGNPISDIVKLTAKTAPIGFESNLSTTTVGLYTNFYVRAFNTTQNSYNNVKITFRIYPNNNLGFSFTKDDISLQYDNNGTWQDIPVSEAVYGMVHGTFGPIQGFTVASGYNEITNFRVKVNKANTYFIYVDFTSYDDNNPYGEIIGSYYLPVRVEPVKFEIYGIDNFTAGNEKGFTLIVKTNNVSEDIDTQLKATFTVYDAVYQSVYPLANQAVRYMVGNNINNWIYDTTDKEGSIYIFKDGIKMTQFNEGMRIYFSTTFFIPGIYNLRFAFVDKDGNEIGTFSGASFEVKGKLQKVGEIIEFPNAKVIVKSITYNNTYNNFIADSGKTFAILTMDVWVSQQPQDRLEWYSNDFIKSFVLENGQNLIGNNFSSGNPSILPNQWTTVTVAIQIRETDKVIFVTVKDPINFDNVAVVDVGQ
ncbi:hypothetical protein O163_02090 [Caldanaerobacter subterraneus subsp. yonseiensis KB-1]|uniref:SLH domain-containing protein n=1 Tax=Caldanaerobacter subterraneus subsp. yonseiensis KB-1 TaxID=1388761 RepID=U5CVU6_CALSX|nr:hypothetical protein O163_02090 [Caldanaerobacter subterraneus subsp. yonseiensis KB-1]